MCFKNALNVSTNYTLYLNQKLHKCSLYQLSLICIRAGLPLLKTVVNWGTLQWGKADATASFVYSPNCNVSYRQMLPAQE